MQTTFDIATERAKSALPADHLEIFGQALSRHIERNIASEPMGTIDF